MITLTHIVYIITIIIFSHDIIFIKISFNTIKAFEFIPPYPLLCLFKFSEK